MKRLGIVLVIMIGSNEAVYADIWSKMFNVKVVKDTNEDQYEYGYQNGYSDGKANNGRGGRISTNKESDRYYNRGYVDGYYEGLMQNNDVTVIYEPRAVIIHNERHSSYDEVPHFELFQSE
jgi:hypothetical protein